MSVEIVECTVVPSPLGPIAVATRAGALCAAQLGVDDPETLRPALERRLGPVRLAEGDGARRVAAALERYFAGEAGALDGIAVDAGGTPFQRAVWDALRAIPPGEVRTYGDLAAALGRPGAARAVGGACARNPIALVVPCHRAVGAGGALTGFAFGVDRKRWLLAHESAGAQEDLFHHRVDVGAGGAVVDEAGAQREGAVHRRVR